MEHRDWGTSLGKIGTGNSSRGDRFWGTKGLGEHGDWGISLGNIATGTICGGISKLGNKWAGEHRDWDFTIFKICLLARGLNHLIVLVSKIIVKSDP